MLRDKPANAFHGGRIFSAADNAVGAPDAVVITGSCDHNRVSLVRGLVTHAVNNGATKYILHSISIIK